MQSAEEPAQGARRAGSETGWSIRGRPRSLGYAMTQASATAKTGSGTDNVDNQATAANS